MNLINVVLIVASVCSGVIIARCEEIRWTSKLLPNPDSADGGTFEARAVSQDGRGNLLIATAKQESTGNRESSVALLKVDSSGDLIWKKTVTKITGTPFDISVDKKTGAAFVIMSETMRKGNLAKAHIVKFINISTNNEVDQEQIVEEVLFSTPGKVGKTKLFGCVRHPRTGDLYVTGGTSASLYRNKSLGGGDAIVIRIRPSGNVLGSIQFGSRDNEVGRAIAMNGDGSALVVVTKRQFPSGSSTSEIYQLHPQDLSIIDGPHSPSNHGETPLFNPKSIAVIGPVASQANTLVTFVGGDGLVRPDSEEDIYVHIYIKIADKIREMTITFDGAKRLKGIDSCVSARAGSDGNMYCLGYTEMNGMSVSRKLNLIAVSPTGELLLASEQAINEKLPLTETPVGATIVESGNRRKLVYVGRVRRNGKTEATIGFIELPKGSVRTFVGFKDVATGAGKVTAPPTTTTTTTTLSNPPSIPVIAGGAAGGLALLGIAIAGFVIFDRWWRPESGVSRTTRATTVTEDYSRELYESFSDAVSPRETSDTGGALV